MCVCSLVSNHTHIYNVNSDLYHLFNLGARYSRRVRGLSESEKNIEDLDQVLSRKRSKVSTTADLDISFDITSSTVEKPSGRWWLAPLFLSF